MWFAIMMAQILSADLPRPLELGPHETEITLIEHDDAELQQRLTAIVDHPEKSVLLRVRRIQADHPPEVSWEVYVASSGPKHCESKPALAGIFSLYGALPTSEFVFPLDLAILASKPIGLKIIFKPTTGLVIDGNPVPPSAHTALRIGDISLEQSNGAE